MFSIPKRVETRLQEGLKKYKRVIANAQKKDFNESDTVTIITDMIADVFGYDKYSEVTSEYAIRNTFCDIAVKVGNKVKLLIECKSVGVKLKDDHVRQAIDYGTKEGITWIVLTNGVEWRVYKIIFRRKPVIRELVFSFDLGEMSARSADDIEKLYSLSREGMVKSKTALSDVYEHISTVNKYMLAQLILEESTVSHLRRMIRKISPDIKVTTEKLGELLESEVLKRDALEPDEAKQYMKIIRRKLGAKSRNETPVNSDENTAVKSPEFWQ